MKMANTNYCCPQGWTLSRVLEHMEAHGIEVMAVLVGENGSALVGIITRAGLKNAIVALNFDLTAVSAGEILSTLPQHKI